jgi:uncharacterized protein (TIGR03437 family)
MRIFKLLLAAGTMAIAAASPTINNVLNAASAQPGIASATWVSIFGTNLATTTTSWGDFTGGLLPTSLGGVKVTVNGLPAYVAFISSGQINALVPDDPTVGMVPVVVTNAQGTSNVFMAKKQATPPALFAYSPQGGAYAVVLAGATYEPVAPPGLLGKSVNTVLASQYENVILWATGLGPTNPAQPTGQLVQTPVPIVNPIQVTIGGQAVTPQFAGLVGSGLYQINVAIPAIPNGTVPIVVTVNGVAAATAYVPIEGPNPPIGGQTQPQLKGCLSGKVDYITYSTGRLPFGEPDDVSVGGTDLCATCSVKTPLFPEFAKRMELALERGKTIQACYDGNGIIYQVSLQQ